MKVTFKCSNGIHYLHAYFGGGTEATYPKGKITANKTEAYSDEEFEPRRNPDTGKYGFQSASGAWMSAQPDGELICNRIKELDYKPEAWEAFEVLRHPNGNISLKTDHGYWVCAEGGGGSVVVADRPAPNAWETFTPSRDFVAGSPLPPGTIEPSPRGRIAVQGQSFVTSSGIFRPCFASMLSILRRGDDQTRALLDWIRDTGFNGIRVFAGNLNWGNLNWCGQSALHAETRLPFLLEELNTRGMYVEVVPITDSAYRPAYNERGHTGVISGMCAHFDNTIIEMANEHWHPTQSEWTHNINNLLSEWQSGITRGVTTALSAPTTDELPQPGPFANFATFHMDRGRDPWNMVRRVKELRDACVAIGKPVMNNEPVGADETHQPGRRLNDPSIFFCMGALNRVCEVGGVFHSQFGLDAVLPGPIQAQCAAHFIRGTRSVRTSEYLTFKNATWADSPIKNANFNNVVRAYSGIYGNRGYTVLVGLTGNPELEFQHGWRQEAIADEVSGCRVIEIRQ